jgi:cell division ATPase FtsA
MIAAAPRDMISGLLAAVEAAGLQPAAVNLVPLAMIKALGDTSWPEADEHRGGSMAEAIVAVGAGTTNVVIHEAGVPSFVRILDQGGNSLTRAIADELDLSWDDAEDLKRRADPMIYGPEEMAARVINSHLAPFIEEIRGSLDYYQVQNGRDGLRRVVLTGAGSRVAGLPERLSVLLGVPVVQGHVLQRLSLGKLRVGEDELAAAEDLLSVAVGLALDGQSGTGTEHALNLLPPEILRRRADRRQLTMAATAVGLLAVGLLGVWFLQHSEATSTASIATQTERSNTTLRARMAPAAGTTGATAGIAERNKLAAQVTKGEVSWSTVLAGVAGSMPTDVWLTSFQGTGATPKSPATVAVNAKGLSYGSASSWLGSMGDSPLISGLWVPNTSTSSENGSVLFTSTFQLTSRALSARQSLLADAAAGRTAKPPVTPVTSTPATTTSTTTSTTTTTTTVPAATTSTAPVAPAQETVDVFNRQQAALDAAGGSPP